MCNVTSAEAVLRAPTQYASAFECQFNSMEYAIAIGLIKPTDVARIICKPERSLVAP